MKDLKINPQETARRLISFIRDNVRKRGFSRVVLGLSGGLDSSTVAYLAAEAVGPLNTLGIIMPYKTTPEIDVKDAREIANKSGIRSKYIEITDMVDAYFNKIKTDDRIRRGNKMARERMSILYDHSKEFDALVLGTGNKTEILIGYCTLYGDSACALAPLGGLYKMQVRQLAKFLGVPDRIIAKAPSAGLWQGQTDEDEIGLSYEELDRMLYLMVEKRYDDARLRKANFSRDAVEKIKQRMQKNSFKMQPPLVARV